MTRYSWVTQEMFDKKLEELVAGKSAGYLLMIPGVYEPLTEYFNNEVLDMLEEERDEN